MKIKTVFAPLCCILCVALTLEVFFYNPVIVSAESAVTDSDFNRWAGDVDSYADDVLKTYINASGNPTLQSTYYSTVVAATAWASYVDYYREFRENCVLNVNDSQTIPAVNCYYGFTYYNNEPHAVTAFGWTNGDKVRLYNTNTVTIVSSDLFSISLTSNQNVGSGSFMYLQSDHGNGILGWASYYGTAYNNFNYWVGMNASGNVLTSYTPNYVVLHGAYSTNSKVTLQAGSVSRYIAESGYTQLFGALEDGRSYNPHLIAPAVLNDPVDIVENIHDQLLTDFPDQINEIWFDLEHEETTEPYTGDIDDIILPPNFPNADFHDIEVPTETLPTGLTDGAGFWFSAFSSLVSGLHLQPYVVLFLVIILACVILKI